MTFANNMDPNEAQKTPHLSSILLDIGIKYLQKIGRKINVCIILTHTHKKIREKKLSMQRDN